VDYTLHSAEDEDVEKDYQEIKEDKGGTGWMI
jgi:hypothetical protein